MSSPHWLTAHAHPQGHSQGGGVADAMLPESILAPAISMIRADEDGGGAKTAEQRLKLMIHPAQAGTLTPTTLPG